MDLTLIPFGVREKDGLFVDVSDVERGRKCGCICPSCKTPLIARQGEIKQWHFAHASRAVYEKTGKECEYSFFVSVRLMARQVVGESLKMKLPKYEDAASLDTDDYGGYTSEKFIVTNERTVSIDNIEIEKQFCGVEVDVYGSVSGYPLILYFTHPGREMPPELMSPEINQCGIVEVSLRNTYSLFVGEASKSQSYLKKLRYFLAEDIQSKRWVFHPRHEKIHAQTLLLLAARRKEQFQHQSEDIYPKKQNVELSSSVTLGSVATAEIHKGEVKYQCVMCGSTWTGVEPGCSPCPKCNTHLYAKHVDCPK